MLRVSAHATGLQIRQAYLKLMRTNHPDISGSENVAPSAVDINQAYWWLSDPYRRAQYDRSLVATHPVKFRPVSTLSVSREPTSHVRFIKPFGVFAVGVATIAALIYARAPMAPTGHRPGSASFSTDIARLAPDSKQAAIVREARLNFEWITLQADDAAVANYSTECWVSLNDDGSDGLLDYCLAFDSAARGVYGRTNAYFSPNATNARARLAAAHLGPGEPTPVRLRRIEMLLARDQHQRTRSDRYQISWFPMIPAAVAARVADSGK